MNAPKVVVVRTGVANSASIAAGLRRAGAEVRFTDDPDDVFDARRALLPGVGAFDPCMTLLKSRGIDAAIAERIRRQRSTLAVCLGMQVLCEGSDESAGTPGLGIVSQRVSRFAGSVAVPHLGWNRVTPGVSCRLIQPGYAYFANSYCLTEAPPEWAHATSDYAGRFVSALERGSVLACQFHPELSGEWGLGLLRRWLGAPC